MSAQDPGAATGQQPYEPNDYRKCPACSAEIGEPCWVLTGAVRVPSGVISASVAADRPHGSRKLRAGAVSRG